MGKTLRDLSGLGIKEEEGIVSKPVLLQIMINIAAVGVLVTDQTPQELLYLSITQLSLTHLNCQSEDSIVLNIERVQLDNQLWSTPYPSIFYPLSPLSPLSSIPEPNNFKNQNSKPINPNPSNPDPKVTNFFSLTIKRDFSYPGVEFIPLLSLSIAPFDVNLEGTIISKLIDFGTAASDVLSNIPNPNPNHNTYPSPNPSDGREGRGERGGRDGKGEKARRGGKEERSGGSTSYPNSSKSEDSSVGSSDSSHSNGDANVGDNGGDKGENSLG
jgi:hypothetical protein